MTPQEKELLTRFLQQLVSAQAGQKDAEAEALIKEAAARQPDAAYLLVQRALQLEQLLQASQEQVKTLQSELDQARAGRTGSFLNDPNAWGSRAATGPAQQPVAQLASTQQPVAQQPLAQPPFNRANPPAQGGSWATGLFGNLAATAAGVVAGSFLFQGIQGLMHRGDSNPLGSHAAALDTPPPLPQAQEPELLNSFDTAEGESGDMFADADDSGDFA